MSIRERIHNTILDFYDSYDTPPLFVYLGKREWSELLMDIAPCERYIVTCVDDYYEFIKVIVRPVVSESMMNASSFPE